jgi:hypothetical protein
MGNIHAIDEVIVKRTLSPKEWLRASWHNFFFLKTTLAYNEYGYVFGCGSNLVTPRQVKPRSDNAPRWMCGKSRVDFAPQRRTHLCCQRRQPQKEVADICRNYSGSRRRYHPA